MASWIQRLGLGVVLVMAAAGCASARDENRQTVPGGGTSGPALEILGDGSAVPLTLEELRAMPASAGWSGTISSTGAITPPLPVKGVSLLALADLVGGLQPDMGINIVAKDGYAITMSYPQITQGAYTTYDPGTGVEKIIDEPLVAVVAYERAGAPIPVDEDGPLRIYILSASNNQIVDGHWSVKWVERLELRPASADWVLSLEGTITEALDRVSFESCTAPGCHQAAWVDPGGDTWTGVPLYLLAGRVDDGVAHEERAYNDAFANAGYALEIFAADGYSVSIPSAQSDFNEDLIVASLLNGNTLGDEHFPLRLVSGALDESQWIGRVVQIVIKPNEGVMPPADVEPPISTEDLTAGLALPPEAVLRISGDVRNQLLLTMENLRSLGFEKNSIEHPTKGPQEIEGVRLQVLLALAGVSDTASMLHMVASDGYAERLPLAELQSCATCWIALQDDGGLWAALGGFPGQFWVKDLRLLAVE